MNNWLTQNGVRIIQVLGGRCNVFLVTQHGKFLLIDSSVTNEKKRLTSRLEALGVDEANLAALILTHAHFDHVENAAMIKEAFKSRIIIHALEADYLRKGENVPIKGSRAVTEWAVDLLAKFTMLHGFYEPVEPDILVDDRFDLSPLGFDAYILHTPGHTPGSMSVLVDKEFALVGDAMSGVFGSVYPPFALDPGLMIASWKTLLDTGCSLYFPAHGVRNIRERVEKQYNRYTEKYKNKNSHIH